MNARLKNKRVVFTMGGKGGVGKTGLMVALAEWFEANETKRRFRCPSETASSVLGERRDPRAAVSDRISACRTRSGT
jgi:Mrp family chromosome partitioning ATPase